MKTVEINIAQCKTSEELHIVLRDALGFPDYYGKNLDALWDCLWEFCRPPMTVRLKGCDAAHESIGEYLDKVVKVFREAELEISGFELTVE